MPQGYDTDLGKWNINDLMKAVEERLQTARTYGLETEILVFSLGAMKKYPDLDPMEAIESACTEWDC